MYFIMKRLLFLVFISLFLVACGTTASIEKSATEVAPHYVASVEIDESMTQAELEAMYGGKTIAFKPNAGFAILGFSKEEGALTTLSTTVNQDAFESPEFSAQAADGAGYSAWAGGFSAWAGGWSAWAGGWSAWAGGFSAWAGGMPDTPKENQKKLNHVIRMNHGHAIANSFGEDIVVAVLDTGIDLNHEMFEGRLTPSTTWYDFVENDFSPNEAGLESHNSYGHGTAVAGTILQVAPKAKIMPLTVLDSNGKGDTDNVIQAIFHAVNHGADIINLSLGADRHIEALEDAVEYATQQRVFVVTSAGNSGSSMTYPAAQATTVSNDRYLMSVGSVNDNGSLSSFSSRGDQLEFLAPGEEVYSAGPGGNKFHASGTSFSAPLLAGTLALGLSEIESRGVTNKGWDFDSYLKQTATQKSCDGRTCYLININKFITVLDGYVKKQALFVVGNPDLSDSDQAVKAYLENLGYNVVVQDDNTSATSQANHKALVLISSTVGARKVGAKFRDVAVPVVTWENHIFDDMKMVSDFGSLSNSNVTTSIDIVSSDHPMAAGLSGQIQVYETDQAFGWGMTSSDAITIARASTDANKSVSFAYEKGASMVGMTATARRVALFGNNSSFGNTNLTSNGILLLEAGISWAVSGN